MNVTEDNQAAPSGDEEVTTPSTATRPRRCAHNRKPPANNTRVTTVDKNHEDVRNTTTKSYNEESPQTH